MKKILISAYAVSPIRGSECAVGWEITRRLGQYFDVTVLMCENTPSGDTYAAEVKQYIAKNGAIKNVSYVSVPMPRKSKIYTWLHDVGFWPAYYWGYTCWQKRAFEMAEKLHAINKFDLMYQLNMIGFREPGYLWKLSVPFVWGPTNGFHSIPLSFLKSLKGKEYVFQHLKHFFNELQILISDRPKKAAKKASVVWCVDEVAQKKIKEWGGKTDLLQETGLSLIEDETFVAKKEFVSPNVLNLVWSGMITSGKALGILIDALVLNKDLNFRLVVLGDGPLLQEMKIRAHSINHKIVWKGWLSKNEAIECVKSSDLLIHTSLKEGTPHSVLEAIAYGIPVVCHDTCGMGVAVNDKNGFKIPYTDFETSTLFVSELLQSIFANPEILNIKYDTIGQTKAMLSWDSKVKYIVDKINTIIAQNEQK
ncbi:glycosyltransferase [Flavobacterium alvei]|uniref:glycosyltransferase n=1 Tax=Flavobacterium alvei TaxID=2080416 RepID=UPI0026E9EE2A|nr:glycosyltransferase [Flavobacterium alvei]